MYLANKYSNYYFNIINHAKARSLSSEIKTEKHHIEPRSFGGSNDPANLVKLTLREHFVCHLLLVRMTEGKFRTKMNYAIWKMCHSAKSKKHEFKISARTYEKIKTDMKTSRTAADFTPEWRAKISKAAKGRAPWNKGIPRTDAVKQAVSNANKGRKTAGFTGRAHTEESKQRISESTKAAWANK